MMVVLMTGLRRAFDDGCFRPDTKECSITLLLTVKSGMYKSRTQLSLNISRSHTFTTTKR